MTDIYHPAVVNQFYKLDKATPTSPYVKTTRWNHTHGNSAGNVINWDGLLCMCAEGAVALDAHTQGRIRTYPGAVHDNQDDNSGGIGVDDVKTAWARGWGQTLLTPADYDWDDLMYAVRVQRRHALLGVDYDYVAYDYQVQKTGSFDHAVGIDDFRASDSRIYRYDSLDTKAIWAPQSAYRGAAEALALRVRGSKGRLFVALSASRPLLSTIQKFRVSITGYTPLYSSPNGTKVGAVRLASYICTRAKISNQWWYTILTKANGSATANRGRCFRPNSNVEANYA